MCKYSDEQFSRIYERTSGYRHVCGKKLAFTNNGRFGARGCWEVENSVARANGGSNHGNNLYAACISCNRGKGTLSSRSCRAAQGRTCALLSRKKRASKRNEQTLVGAGAGALIGMTLGPGGAIVGGLVGALLGNTAKID